MTRKNRPIPKRRRDGRCRNKCGCQVPKGRRSFCSTECSTDFAIKYYPRVSRRYVFKRDRGVCAICGCDTEKLRRILSYVVPQCSLIGFKYNHKRFRLRKEGVAIAVELGFDAFGNRGRFWQADHILPCARGGWGLGFDNFRTLCTPCHRQETAKLEAELAAERKAA